MTVPKRSLLRRIESRARHELGIPPRWTHQRLVGHELILRDGTLRPEVDYDDAWLFECLKRASIVFDVGANVGQMALLALSQPSVKQVVLIEANWEALSVAAENLVRNGLSTRARFVGAFASDDESATIEFWTVGTGAAGSMFQGHAVSAAKAGSVQRVPTVTLDALSREFELVPDLVKIDVEGAESKVLAGAAHMARHDRTRFFVEMHSPPELPMERNAGLILDWARTVSHAVWYLASGERLTSPDKISHRGRCHLLIQPAAWPYPEWLVGIKQGSALIES